MPTCTAAEHPVSSSSEASYKSAPSGISPEDTVQMIDSDGPEMSKGQKGIDFLKTLITYGSPAGMPNWGTSGDFTDEEIDTLARFLQHDPPEPPQWGMAVINDRSPLQIVLKSLSIN